MKGGGKRKGKRGKITIVLPFLFLLSAFLYTFAFAHQPYWNGSSPTPEQAFVIENVTVSKALFGNLEGDEVDYFRLEVTDGFELDSSLFVGGGCSASFSPQLYLLSLYLPGTNQETKALTFALPDGYGAIRAEGDWKPYSGHGLKGREGPSVRETLETGTYYLVVQSENSNQERGFYLLSLGGSEAFGGGAGGREAIPRFNACQ